MKFSFVFINKVGRMYVHIFQFTANLKVSENTNPINHITSLACYTLHAT